MSRNWINYFIHSQICSLNMNFLVPIIHSQEFYLKLKKIPFSSSPQTTDNNQQKVINLTSRTVKIWEWLIIVIKKLCFHDDDDAIWFYASLYLTCSLLSRIWNCVNVKKYSQIYFFSSFFGFWNNEKWVKSKTERDTLAKSRGINFFFENKKEISNFYPDDIE